MEGKTNRIPPPPDNARLAPFPPLRDRQRDRARQSRCIIAGNHRAAIRQIADKATHRRQAI